MHDVHRLLDCRYEPCEKRAAHGFEASQDTRFSVPAGDHISRYRRAVDKLTELLVTEEAIHAVRLKQKSNTRHKKKITAAVYEYQVDCDSEWGEISVNFENGTAEIIRLANWDTMKTNCFANKAIAYLLNCENEKLPKETMLAFEQI